MKNPCHGCQGRQLGCHAKCGSYEAFRAWREAVNGETAERNREESDVRAASERRYRRDRHRKPADKAR